MKTLPLSGTFLALGETLILMGKEVPQKSSSEGSVSVNGRQLLKTRQFFTLVRQTPCQILAVLSCLRVFSAQFYFSPFHHHYLLLLIR